MTKKMCFRSFAVLFLILGAAACNLNVGLTPSPEFPTPLPITPFPQTKAAGTLPAETAQPTALLPTVSQPTLASPTHTPPAGANTPTTPPPAATAGVPAGAIRLLMGAGRTVVYADSTVAAGSTINYVVGAAAGQFMMTMLSSANQSLYVQVKAPDGSLLVSAAAKKNYWQGSLPLKGDYLVSVVSSGSAGDFDLGVTIPARVVFDAGAVSETMNATVGANGITTFLLRGQQDQTLSVKIISTVGDVFLTIYGLQDGQPYVRSVTGQTSYSFKLPSTQDYVIQCVNTGNKSEDLIVTFKAQ
jgi:hypothetical protein